MNYTTIYCMRHLTLVCESAKMTATGFGVLWWGKTIAGGVIDMIVKADLDVCRKGMQSYIGKRVRLRSNGGRKRTIVQEGVLDRCYPNVFTVRCARKNVTDHETVSFSYIDILTRVVEIAIEPESDRRKDMTH